MEAEESLSLREKEILKTVCDLYLKREEAISSGFLSQRFFEVAPSTLRINLFSLERKGFLKKIHSSSGRIPTDFGLRFYLKYLSSKQDCPQEIKKFFKKDFEEKDFFERKNLEKLVEFLVEKISNLILAQISLAKEEILIKEGFLEFLKDKWHQDEFEELIRDLEIICENFSWFFKKKLASFNFLIGKELPLVRKDFLGMVKKEIVHPLKKSKKIMIAFIGKRSMNYLKNLAILEEIKKMVYER